MTEPGFYIRCANPADAEAMAGIAIQNPFSPSWTSAQYASLLTPDQEGPVMRMAWLAEQDGRATGFAVLSLLLAVDPAEAELESIAVSPNVLRNGTGKALLAVVTAAAAKHGADRLRLEVRCGNGEALAFYDAMGFRCTGTRRGYYNNPVDDAVCMDRIL